MTKSLKPATTVAAHIERLRHRGMDVDETLAYQWLSNVSYYRLSGYWYPARRVDDTDTVLDEFKAGTAFSDAIALYEADRKLRTLVHDGMERIEIAMRTRLGELLCSESPVSYKDPTRFRSEFDHAQWLATTQKRVNRSARTSDSIKHYRSTYDGNYPFWVLAEVLDFSDISHLFNGLPATGQRTIAESLGIVIHPENLSREQRRKATRQSPLAPWMHQMTVVRNITAHHGRLWNRSFVPAPTTGLRTQGCFHVLPVGQSERIFGALTVMAHLLRVVSPGTSWPAKVADHMASQFMSNELVHPRAMGLPENWQGTL
ncbi:MULTISPECIES: Abi family protein [Kocuria]|uniref:Abi family protein n=1 Tax=Kocuria TaxID=57493 RepID=UPI0021A79F92|nr:MULTISPECIES: Abi family protein [Kocuria]MCT1545115.1 Abi family protein [Kocuria rhizophila]MCT2171685.1 Abi family protein [Kocuria rhizophila]MDN3463507.1 Abi family protein [Kocuria sp. APC 4018]